MILRIMGNGSLYPGMMLIRSWNCEGIRGGEGKGDGKWFVFFALAEFNTVTIYT